MIVINGSHTGESLGTIERWDGCLVQIWSLNTVDLISAMTQAIGHVPTPPDFEDGGKVEYYPGDVRTGQPPQIMYNPSGDVRNQSKASAFASEVLAWNARAQAIQLEFDALIKDSIVKKG